MTARRSALSAVSIAAAVAPAVFWLLPALTASQAPTFRDQGDFFYPIKLYTIARIRAGEIPLWNPLSGTGEPWLANGQSGVFYPPNYFFLIPSPALAAGLFLFFHFCVGVWGMWKFLKDEGVSDAGSLLGCVIFCGSGLTASLSSYWNHFGAWAFLPGLAAFARTGLETRRERLGLAMLVALSAMAGSPEMTLAGIGLSLAFLFVPSSPPPSQWQQPSRRRAVARIGVATLLGLVVAAWVLVPMGELVLHSDRRNALPAAERELGAVGLSGLASAVETSAAFSGTSYLGSLYVGPVAILAAAAAFGEPRRRRLVGLLAGLFAGGVVLAAAGWPGAWLRALPLLDRMRYPAKALVLAHLSLCILAALGLDRQRFSPGGFARRVTFAVLAAGAAVLSLAAPGDGLARLFGAGAAVGFLLLSCGAGRFARVAGPIAAVCAIGVTVVLAVAGRPLFRFAEESEIRRGPESVASLSRIGGRVLTPPMADLARRCLTSGRFDREVLRCQRDSLLGYTNLLSNIRTVRTAAALPTRAARKIEDAADASRATAAAAGAASARILWTPFRPAELPSLKMGDFYRAPLVPYRPRLSFARAFRTEPDADRAWNEAANGRVDLTREVLLDRAPSTPLASSPSGPLLLARLVEDRPETVVAEITTNTPGLLVLTDLWYPGWIAEADGKREEIRRADGFFRAVPLPKGTHRVVFRYRPISVLAGGILSGAGLLTVILAALAAPPRRESLL